MQKETRCGGSGVTKREPKGDIDGHSSLHDGNWLPSSLNMHPGDFSPLSGEDTSLLCYYAARFVEQLGLVDPKVIKQMVDEMESRGAFGKVTTWDGKERFARLDDFHGRFREVAPDQLVRHFGNIIEKGTALSHPISKTSDQSDCRSHCLALISLRERERALRHEYSRLVSPSTLSLSASSDKQIESTKSALRDIENKIHRLRFVLRDHRVQRPRRSSSVLDLLSYLQRGSTIGNRLENSSRRIAYSRLRTMKKIGGHKAEVYCVAVDGSGQWIVTGSDDALLKLWNARTGELTMTYRAHEKMICDLAIDSSGKYIVSCSADTTVRLWNLLSGRNIACLKAHLKSVNSVCFCPADNHIVSCADDGMCCLWDTKRLVKNDEDQVRALAAGRSSDSQPQDCNVVSARVLAEAGITTFLDPKIPIVLPHLSSSGIETEVNALSMHPKGGMIATGSSDGLVRVWSIGHQKDSRNAAKTRSRLLPCEYVDGASRLVCTLTGHLDVVGMVAWSHKGDHLLSGSTVDGTVRVWSWPFRFGNSCKTNFASRSDCRVISIATGVITGHRSSQQISSAPRTPGNRFKVPELDNCAWSGDDSFVIVLQSVKRRKRWAETESYKGNVEFFDQRVSVYHSMTGQLIHSICAHRKPAFVLKAHPSDHGLFLTGGHDGRIMVWDVYSGKNLCIVSVPSEFGPQNILDGVFTPTGCTCTIVATDQDGRLILIGTEDSDAVYGGAYPEQFFETDYALLLRDTDGNVVDRETELPCHLVGRKKIVDRQGIEYIPQPYRLTKPSARIEEQLENLADRKEAVRRLEKRLHGQEELQVAKAEEIGQKVDALIEKANKLDKIANQTLHSEEYDTRQYQDASQKPEQAEKRPLPGTKQGATQREERPKLLACEREQDVDQKSESESDGSSDSVNSTSHDENLTGKNRSGRQAARKAQQRIIKQFRVFDGGAAADSSDASVNDENYSGVVDGEEEEMSDSDESDDENYEERTQRRRRTQRVLPRRSSARIRNRRSSSPPVYANEDSEENNFSGEESETSDETNDSDESEASDESESSEIVSDRGRRAKYATRKKGSKRMASQRSTAHRAREELIRHFDRKWLLETQPCTGVSSQFVPQKGDKLVFCVQGHLQYLKKFPMNGLPAWKTSAWRKEWSFVLCSVRSVDYVFPAAGSCVIQTVLDLSIEAVPKVNSRSSFFPAPTQQIWDFNVSKVLPIKRLSVGYQPNHESEFLIFQERFELAMHSALHPGCRVQVLFAEGASPARIVSLQAYDQKWPGSPWMCVSVLYDDDQAELENDETVVDNVSPWELVRGTDRTRAGGDIEHTLQCELTYNSSMPELVAERISEGMHEVLDENSEDAAAFVAPVDLAVFADYGTIVPLPMDIQTIQARLEEGYYRHIDAVKADLALVRKNCFLYNDSRAPICSSVKRLVASLNSVLTKVELGHNSESTNTLLANSWGGKSRRKNSDGSELDFGNGKQRVKQQEKNSLSPKIRDQEICRSSSARLVRNVEVDALIRALQNAILEFFKRDRQKDFRHPVDPRIFPSYTREIRSPMDLGTMQTKLRNKEYGLRDRHERTISRESAIHCLSLFQADSVLICSNAMQFNSSSSRIYKAAIALKKTISDEMLKIAQGLLGLDEWKAPELENISEDSEEEDEHPRTLRRRQRVTPSLRERSSTPPAFNLRSGGTGRTYLTRTRNKRVNDITSNERVEEMVNGERRSKRRRGPSSRISKHGYAERTGNTDSRSDSSYEDSKRNTRLNIRRAPRNRHVRVSFYEDGD